MDMSKLLLRNLHSATPEIRFLIVVLFLLLLGACALQAGKQKASVSSTADTERDKLYGGYRWMYEDFTDEMSDKKGRSATVYTRETRFGIMLDDGDNRGMLTVRKHPRFGQSVILHVRQGALRSGALYVRFDDKPAQRFLTDSGDRQQTLFILDDKRFIKALKSADSIRVELPFYHWPATIIRFNVSGLRWP